ncbi:SMI1/KNR4 family protein [Kitasatospora sp. NPDC059811]|uniref:SMI1/KNR4 family protein n=1 Tax=Streptomycetaceae TaxID=2062 RepID=UPI0007AFC840|nr:SMI1/KNR4 family protein [Streptomyces sp. MJM8645]
MRSIDWDDVRGRVRAVREERAWSGAGAELAAPLAEIQVVEAERQFGITFPADYREFLLRVSAGGRWPKELRQGPHGWHWAGDADTQLERLHVPFPDHDTALAASDEVWEKCVREEDYADPADFAAARDARNEAVEAAERDRVTGGVFLAGHGHNFSTLLIVSGSDRGSMWFDGRPTCDRLNPLLTDAGRPAGFGEWYIDWLEHEEGLTTPELEEAARNQWHRGVGTPIWLRWFDDWEDNRRGR